MRLAMADAEVGDDVFGEDPTVHKLEARVAHLLGKEAALFVPSGVMGNQIALMVHCRRGDEVILADQSHIFHYESGAPAVLAGVQLRPVDAPRGLLTPDHVDAAVRGGNDWEPRSRLVCLENTGNRAGGVVYPPPLAAAVASRAREHGLRVHLDGARLWNAAVALNLPERDLAEPFDTVNVCLSKGLGAPAGSVLAGSREHVRVARRYRKLLGGGMRQVGILAAGGLHALEHHRTDLAADHRRARILAAAMATCSAFSLNPEAVETNIVMANTVRQTASEIIARLAADDVHVVAFGPHTIRATTHRDIGDTDVERAISAFRAL